MITSHRRRYDVIIARNAHWDVSTVCFIFFLQYSQAAKEKVGFALYGLGRIGQIHIENLLSNTRAELRWLVEENSALVEEVTRQYGLKGKVKQANLEEIPKMLADKRYGFGNHPGFL